MDGDVRDLKKVYIFKGKKTSFIKMDIVCIDGIFCC